MKKIKIRMSYGIKRIAQATLVDIPSLPTNKFYLHESKFSISSFKYSVTESKSGVCVGRGDTKDEAYLSALVVVGYYTKKSLEKDIKYYIEHECFK